MKLALEQQSRNGNGRHLALAGAGEADLPSEREFITSVRDELDGYAEKLCDVADSDPRDAMGILSSVHARLTQIRLQLQRAGSQRVDKLRTRELDPMIEAVEFQFKVASRVIATTELEWNMAQGQNS